MWCGYPDLKTAYELKEAYIHFNESASAANARSGLADMLSLIEKADIRDFDSFYDMLINWNEEIINSFTQIGSRRTNNSYIESRNRQIETLMYNANGFKKNFRRTRNRILYCINKNDSFTFYYN